MLFIEVHDAKLFLFQSSNILFLAAFKELVIIFINRTNSLFSVLSSEVKSFSYANDHITVVLLKLTKIKPDLKMFHYQQFGMIFHHLQ